MTTQTDHSPHPSSAPCPPSRSHSAGPSTPRSHSRNHTRIDSKTSSQIYVLSADGSRLFLLDPSAPERGEEPPAYHTILSPASATAPLSPAPDHASWQIGVEEEGPSSPRSVRIQALPSIRSSASLMIPPSPSAGRQRSYTASSAPAGRTGRAMSVGTGLRSGIGERAGPSRVGMGRAESYSVVGSHEETPLLGARTIRPRGRGKLRSILCGEVKRGDEDMTWSAGWRRYWHPLIRGEYWRCALHLLLLNFPFVLLIWPFLFAGTVAGTALLITLPIGAAVWWLTLILARTAARVEITMQVHHHVPIAGPLYHPIFYRQVHGPPPSALSNARASSVRQMENEEELVWEKGFIKCSYAMFCDYYSYSALSYFALLKPLITLFSTIAIIVLGAVALGTIVGIPVYLRALRHWGVWQAGFAVDNL